MFRRRTRIGIPATGRSGESVPRTAEPVNLDLEGAPRSGPPADFAERLRISNLGESDAHHWKNPPSIDALRTSDDVVTTRIASGPRAAANESVPRGAEAR